MLVNQKLDFDFGGILNTDSLSIDDFDEAEGIRGYPSPKDSDFVIKSCPFLSEYADTPGQMDLEQLHAWLSVVTRLPNGQRKARELLEKNLANFDRKFISEQTSMARARSGPRTCKDIDKRCPQCNDCKYWGTITSPINIQPDEYIKTKDTGFWEVGYKGSRMYYKKPCYADLVKFYEQTHSFVTMKDNQVIYNWTGTHWKEEYISNILAFAQEHLNPKPQKSQRGEFQDLLKITHLKDPEWLTDDLNGLINLKNGVYDTHDNKLKPHSKSYGFRYVLPYEYDETADCPKFVKFLDEVTLGRKDLKKIILEFMGWALSSGPYKSHKCLILYGTGSNGKSTLLDVFKALAGKDNYSSLSLSALNIDTKRYMIDGKLFNVGEETDIKALDSSEVFKTLTSGGEIDVKRLYSQDYTIKSKCKFIMACNELPKSNDRTDGLYRRMLPIPFDAKFEGSKIDESIFDKLVEELPGIFNLILSHYKDFVDRKYRFTKSQAMDDVLEAYKTENDNVRMWSKDRLRLEPIDSERFKKIFIDKEILYSDYKNYCEANGLKSASKINLFKRLRVLVPKWDEKRITNTDRGVLKRVRIIYGIAIDDLI